MLTQIDKINQNPDAFDGSIMPIPEIIYGLKPVQEALQSGQSINRIYLAKESRASGCKGVVDEAKRRSIPFDFSTQSLGEN